MCDCRVASSLNRSSENDDELSKQFDVQSDRGSSTLSSEVTAQQPPQHQTMKKGSGHVATRGIGHDGPQEVPPIGETGSTSAG